MRTHADELRRLAKLLDENFEINKEEVARQLKILIKDIKE